MLREEGVDWRGQGGCLLASCSTGKLQSRDLCAQTPEARGRRSANLMSPSPVCAVLLPLTDDARALTGPYGPRLWIARDGSCIGRAPPASKTSMTVDSRWLQVSSNHCRVQWDSEQVSLRIWQTGVR